MAKRFTLSKSQVSKLSYEIRRFNSTMESLLGDEGLKFEYKEIKPLIGTKREYDRMINRLMRLQKPSAQIIHESVNGTKYVQWEKNELPRLTQIANTKRKEGEARAKEASGYTFLPPSDQVKYRQRQHDIKYLQSRELLKIWFKTEMIMGSSKNLEISDKKYQKNVIKSLGRFPNLKPIRDLKRLLKDADPYLIYLITKNPVYGVSIAQNYQNLLKVLMDEETELEIAQNLYDRWNNALTMADIQRKVDAGEK